MKKTIFSLMALSVLTVAILGCKKKTETPPATTGTATVEGYIKVNLNQRNDTLPDGSYSLIREGIPTSVTLTFVIDSEDLEKNPDPSYSYELIQKTTTVDASGKYSISLPTPKGSNSINGELKISAFEYNPIITSSQNTDSTAARVVVNSTNMNFSIYNGGKTIIDHNF
ncbi:hypothetical protein [Fluviicola taffensis]|jgi:hypothetical protein|uniref:Lipoprotein n=1 Tax=Fluviicola taffensis (strain DSM 16823 / NCIMB 13979 / RW262) TaxID=755732 RepID=F2IDF9_FLUTR|nr:hypothetical protein [Fluviicola taffensis]AEA42335.1 hypothetical protein Fluta_0326 [Fluviicola taffensis DSM 16823]